MIDLPITPRLPDIQQGLRTAAALILEAPPGAGKTTLVPLALLDEPWLDQRKILVLEPRRIAAKAAARRMASLLNESVGRTVGYRVRNDTSVSADTRIEVITEGILTRMLISNSELPDVGCVIFDEFHERSIHADVGLGLLLLVRDLVRPDLRIVVMSATLASLPLEKLLPDATVVQSLGRSFPITDTWLRSADTRPLQTLVAAAVSDALHQNEGDILVFLPGIADIRRCEEALRTVDAEVLSLYGDLSPVDQDRILRPGVKGARRRVILSTAVAESSITIDGVSTVIDSGLAREPRFDPRSGMTHLVTVPVSKDAAEQRRGRAGRTGPGHCIRLWTEDQHRDLAERRTPEILSADLAPLVLDLAAFGAGTTEVAWLDSPPTAAVGQARELLQELDALTDTGALTPHGRSLSHLGTHPRLAHMQVRASERGFSSVAVWLTEQIELNRRSPHSTAEVHRSGADPMAVGTCLAFAYPDRVARKKEGSRYLLRNGRTARLADHDSLSRNEWLAVGMLGGGSEPWISMAAPLTEDVVRDLFQDQIIVRTTAGWDHQTEKMRAVDEEILGAIVIKSRPAADVDEDALALAFAAVIVERDYRDLPWTKSTAQLRDRIAFLRALPNAAGGEPLTKEAMAPFVHGMRSMSDLKSVSLQAMLSTAIPWEERQRLDLLAPTTWTTPRGRQVSLDYADPVRPMLSVRLQDMFGVVETPRVANGSVPVTVQLLSPANRPIQITQDLAGFWTGSYAEVRKEMRGRYPKHDWPEDPLGRT